MYTAVLVVQYCIYSYLARYSTVVGYRYRYSITVQLYGTVRYTNTRSAAIILPYYGRLRSCRFGDTIRYISLIVLASEGDPGS